MAFVRTDPYSLKKCRGPYEWWVGSCGLFNWPVPNSTQKRKKWKETKTATLERGNNRE